MCPGASGPGPLNTTPKHFVKGVEGHLPGPLGEQVAWDAPLYPPAMLPGGGRRSAAPGSPGYMGDYRGEVCGAVELHRAQAAVVRLQDAVNATARGVLLVAILGQRGAN